MLFFLIGVFGYFNLLAGTSAIAMPDKMKVLCEKDAGQNIYRTVSNVEGYARIWEDDSTTIEEITNGRVSNSSLRGGCFPCFNELLRDRYKYIETYYVRSADRRKSEIYGDKYHRDYDVSSTGLFRYQLVDREKGRDLCVPYDQMKSESLGGEDVRTRTSDSILNLFAKGRQQFAKEMIGKCIYAEPISHISAPYVERMRWTTISETSIRNNFEKIVKIRHSIEDVDGQLLAESVLYSLLTSDDPMAIADARCGTTVLPPITDILRPLSNIERKE